MLRKLLFGITIVLFASCGVDHTDFSGDWIDKKNERDRMIIKRNGDNYIVENRGKKYPAQIRDGLLEISAELPIKATIDDNDNLIIAGDEYIRFDKSKKYVLEKEIVIESGKSPCIIKEIYEKKGMYFATVDYTKLVGEDENSGAPIYGNDNPKLRTFLITKNTKFYDGFRKKMSFDFSKVSDYVGYPAWHIRVKDGRITSLTQQYYP